MARKLTAAKALREAQARFHGPEWARPRHCILKPAQIRFKLKGVKMGYSTIVNTKANVRGMAKRLRKTGYVCKTKNLKKPYCY